MGNAVLLNASFLSAEALGPFASGPSALERSLAFAASLHGVTRLRLSGWPKGLPVPAMDAFPGISLRPELGAPGPLSPEALVAELEAAAAGSDQLFLMPADAPLLDSVLTERLWRLHQGQAAEYSFADGYPLGLAPEILKSSILPILSMLAKGMGEAAGRDALFSVIQKDINGFDIETEISPVDLRAHRLSLTCDSRRNRLITEALFEALEAQGGGADALLSLIGERRDLLRSLPAWLAVQVSAACPQACSLCPYPLLRPDLRETAEFMPVERFQSILSQMEELAGDAVVSPSLWGEASLHPRIVEILAAILGRPGFRGLVETSGLGWKEGVLEGIAALPGASGRLDWILSLDAMTEGTYRLLRGEGMAEALRTAERLLSLFPGRVHVQALRVMENEAELEAFHKEWKARGAKVIIQKHDDFSGFLPKRKLVDLSPLKRHECWHLKRDISVLIDGTIPLCREDLKRTSVLGNAFEKGLAAAWEAMGKTFLRHVAGDYEGLCAACDEYYTYNF